MKGFLIFYSAIIIIVFCLMSNIIAVGNIVTFFDNTNEVTVTIKGAVKKEASFTVSNDTYLGDVIRLVELAPNADLTNINKYQFVTNKTYEIPYGIINVSTALVPELVYLVGVAEITAQAIIDYRTENPFNTIEDFKVKWNSIYDKNPGKITV